jgi:hypothetical protein
MGEGAPLLTLRPLPLQGRRAVGGPVSQRLLAAYFSVALLAWIAATAAAVAAAPALAAGHPLADTPVLAVHLLVLGALPFAVCGASFHLLPVMLRNDLPSQRALWLALALLAGGFPVASGLAPHEGALVWTGAALLVAGLAIVLAEIVLLVARAPTGRVLVASRLGVCLACLNVVAALTLGALVFAHDSAFGGVAYRRWLLVHLHLSLLGWIALLIVTVGRNLAPMLAQAPASPSRRVPLEEAGLVLGLWVLVTGLALDTRALTLFGAATVVLALARFAALLGRIARARRGSLEAPLAHLLAGAFFLVQAAGTGLAAAAGWGGTRLVSGYLVFLLVGWAGGVVIGHVGKLLSLSIWVWWPPGPRPKQADLYPRRLGLAETVVFAVGTEALAVGVFAASSPLARAGATLLLASALLTAASAAATWQRRPRAAA